MKLALTEQKLSHGEAIVSRTFGVDTTIAMIALREKIYANPRYAAVQEYMSNGRDANREAGRGLTPICVDGPEADNPTMIFRDSGIGINPDRMENVFTCYGKSTKRSSNGQTGGWGLGCKAGFAVSDQFTVVTRWEDGERLMQSTYLMFINEKQESAFSKLSEEEVDAELGTGTEIHLPINPVVVREFRDAVERIGAMWGHPLVEASATPVLSWEPSLDGYGKTLSDLPSTGNYIIPPTQSDNWRKTGHWLEGKLVIDGIPYATRKEALSRIGLTKGELTVLSNVAVFYKTGEIMVTATREDIDYTNAVTVATLRNSVDAVNTSMTEQLNLALSGSTNLIDASRRVRALSAQFGELFSSVAADARWKTPEGAELELFDFEKTLSFVRKYKGFDTKEDGMVAFSIVEDTTTPEGFRKQRVSSVTVKDNLFVVCNVKTNRHNFIRGVLSQICVPRVASNERRKSKQFILIANADSKGLSLDPAETFKELGLEHFPFKGLSKYPMVKIQRASISKPHPENLLRVIGGKNGRDKRENADFQRTTRSVECPKGGIYVFYYKNKPYHDAECTQKVEEMSDLLALCKQIYGVNPRAKDKLHPAWLSVAQWKAKVAERVKDKYLDYMTVDELLWVKEMSGSYVPLLMRNRWRFHEEDTTEEGQRLRRVETTRFARKPHYYVKNGTLAAILRLMLQRCHYSDGVARLVSRHDKSHSRGEREKAYLSQLGASDWHAIEMWRRALNIKNHIKSVVAHTWQERLKELRATYPLLNSLTFSHGTIVEVAAYITGKDAFLANKTVTINPNLEPPDDEEI